MSWPTLRTGLSRLFLSAALAVAAQPSAAFAASIAVMPVRVEVAPSKQFCSLSVSNEGAEEVTVQVRAYVWKQQPDGTDVLEHSASIAVNPSIATIPAGGKKLIRCSLPAKSGPNESTFRLLVNELPRSSVQPGTLQTLLQLSIPVFQAPQNAQPALSWLVGDDGRLYLMNNGTRHARVNQYIVRRTGGEPSRIDRGFYLLAGSRRAIDLDASAADVIGVDVMIGDGAVIPAIRRPSPSL